MDAKQANDIFKESIKNYHKTDDINFQIQNPYSPDTINNLLYLKNWIDTVQWHLEDEIRSPHISSSELVNIKRRIDKSNQDRTDIVEKIDDWLLEEFKNIKPKENARMNSETPAWLLDRMSILQLKIYHFKEQTERKEASEEHILKANKKLEILLDQQKDLIQCFDELIDDFKKGEKFMKVYRQMKMYNDPNLNPILYSDNRQ